MAKKSAQPNAAGFIEIQNKAVQPEQTKAPKKKAEKKEEEVTPVVAEPVVSEEPVVASEPVADSAEQFTRGFLVKNRRGFDPDARIKDADFAFRVLGDSVFTKGFLGPSLRENRGLPSVGVSSARRAGVIVDDNGKMRCPPGTPNANQFTDINMSNCMIPSAETAARNAAEVAANLASRSIDGFKRSSIKKKNKDRDLIPDAKVGFADGNGLLEQRRVPVGKQVVSPIDGSSVILQTRDDSIKHIADGGDLSDIPDEHLVDAIMKNAVGKDNNYVGPPLRFEIIGRGGGINGMTRMIDGKTGALIGLKYSGGTDTSPQPMQGNEALNEAVAEVLQELMGYEPTPMRLVIGSNGFGLALMSELVHNRHRGSIEGMRGYERPDNSYAYNLPPEEIARMRVLDAILQNPDRHEGNSLIADDDGVRSLLPIDNSRAFSFSDFTDAVPKSKLESGEVVSYFQPWITPGGDAEMEKFATDEGFAQLISAIAGVQQQLRTIDTDLMESKIDEILSHVRSLGTFPSSDRRDNLVATISRIKGMRNGNPEDIAEALMPAYKRKQILEILEQREKYRAEEEARNLRELAGIPDVPKEVVSSVV